MWRLSSKLITKTYIKDSIKRNFGAVGKDIKFGVKIINISKIY